MIMQSNNPFQSKGQYLRDIFLSFLTKWDNDYVYYTKGQKMLLLLGWPNKFGGYCIATCQTQDYWPQRQRCQLKQPNQRIVHWCTKRGHGPFLAIYFASTMEFSQPLRGECLDGQEAMFDERHSTLRDIFSESTPVS